MDNHKESEKKRIESLESYNVLDSLPEEDYDFITKMAAQICGTKVSLVSLVDVDRQWFKSKFGIEVSETEREYSFCSRAIECNQDIYIIHDARLEDEYRNNPLVTGDPYIVFYAGVPLVNEDGFVLGSLCVIDTVPKVLTNNQQNMLKSLARQVVNLLELRRSKFQLNRVNLDLKSKNERLEEFSYIAAHDIKSPLSNIQNLTNILRKKLDCVEGDKSLEIVDLIHKMSERLRRLVNGLLDFSMSNKYQSIEMISLKEVEKDLKLLFEFGNAKFDMNSSLEKIYFNKSALHQILNNLVGNAIKYNDKEIVEITVLIEELGDNYIIQVKDNGVGVSADAYEKMFKTFVTLQSKDKFGVVGTGLGLSIVKKIITEFNGEIDVESELGVGTNFVITIPNPK